VLGRGEKRREARRGPVKSEVGAHPFIVVGEGHAGREWGKRLAAMALTPL
jgi:hypothetical protein